MSILYDFSCNISLNKLILTESENKAKDFIKIFKPKYDKKTSIIDFLNVNIRNANMFKLSKPNYIVVLLSAFDFTDRIRFEYILQDNFSIEELHTILLCLFSNQIDKSSAKKEFYNIEPNEKSTLFPLLLELQGGEVWPTFLNKKYFIKC